MNVRATLSKRSVLSGIGEITYLGTKASTAMYFLSFERQESGRDNGWNEVNMLTFALKRVFGKENLTQTSTGILIEEKLVERVRNTHGLIRNRLDRIRKAYEDIMYNRVPLTDEELGISKRSFF